MAAFRTVVDNHWSSALRVGVKTLHNTIYN